MTAINFFPRTGFDVYQAYGKLEIAMFYGLALAGVDLHIFGELRPDWWTYSQEAKLLGQGCPGLAPITLTTCDPLVTLSPLNQTRVWLYGMIETTRLGDIAVDEINAGIERVLVPVPGLVDVYYQSGIKVPVHCIGYGADYFVPPYREPRYPDFDKGEKFTFLTYSQGDRRKGADLAILAFKTLFNGDDRFQLLIKARDGYRNSWLDALMDDPQITIIGGLQTDADWHRLLHESHCTIHPTRGEGIGYVGRDSVLAGTPAIVTQCLGTYDVDRWGFAIPPRIYFPFLHHGKYYTRAARDNYAAEPDTDVLIRQMERIVQPDAYQSAVQFTKCGRDYLLSQKHMDVAHNIRRLLEIYQ